MPIFHRFINLFGRNNYGSKVLYVATRNLNLMEYQSKDLLRKNHVTVQDFVMIDDVQGTKAFQNFICDEYVIKAQILAGGRGKGHFDNGFKGGVHVVKDRESVVPIAKKMLGQKLITKQTPKDGVMVHKVMVANSVDIKRETYLCIAMDRAHNGPVIIASPAGGVDIEQVAEQTPELLKTEAIDICGGISNAQACSLAKFLGFNEQLQSVAGCEIQRIWELFLKVDATQLEINPLAETADGRVVAVDAKINFDDNAKFRQKEIFAAEDLSEYDVREVEAAAHNLNYIRMDGNIGCLVNGAGLAMATMDIIKLYGGSPANFLDVGGGVKEDQVKTAFNILTSDKNVQSILVNVFGGIVNCATIANGIVSASKSIGLKVPLVVRLEGTNVEEARKILKESGIAVTTATDLDDAAIKAVASLKQ